MAVSKRLRYEILRRDNHACRYCGAAAPEVKLTVDHVIPVALGVSDEPSNLVAACANCNSGKSASNPDATLVDDVQQSALRWGAAMRTAADTMLAELEQRHAVYDEFLDAWNGWRDPASRTLPLPDGWQQSVSNFLAAGLPMPLLLDCVDLAMGRKGLAADARFRYMCGIAWNRVSQLQEAAQQALSAGNPGIGTSHSCDGWDLAEAYGDAVRTLLRTMTDLEVLLLEEKAAQKWPGHWDTYEPNDAQTRMLRERDVLLVLARRNAMQYFHTLPAAAGGQWRCRFNAESAHGAAAGIVRNARLWHEYREIPNGMCIATVDGELPCEHSVGHRVWFQGCKTCASDVCAGHDWVCDQHLDQFVRQGCADGDGNVLSIVKHVDLYAQWGNEN